MRTIKTLIAAAMLTVGLAAMAGQPVLLTMNMGTNTLSNITTGSATWAVNPFLLTTASGATVTNFDSEFQSQYTVYFTALPTWTGAYTAGGTLTASTLVSPDSLTWFAGPSFALAYTASNVAPTLVSNTISTTYRYMMVTNFVGTVTNSYFTNGSITFKIFYKTL